MALPLPDDVVSDMPDVPELEAPVPDVPAVPVVPVRGAGVPVAVLLGLVCPDVVPVEAPVVSVLERAPLVPMLPVLPVLPVPEDVVPDIEPERVAGVPVDVLPGVAVASVRPPGLAPVPPVPALPVPCA